MVRVRFLVMRMEKNSIGKGLDPLKHMVRVRFHSNQKKKNCIIIIIIIKD
jgi:hypothetical protein